MAAFLRASGGNRYRSLEYRKGLVNFWSTFVQSGYLLLILGQHIIKRLSLDFFGSAPVLTAKRNLRQRVLSIEVRVHRKQLFRRDQRQVPSFDHASLFLYFNREELQR